MRLVWLSVQGLVHAELAESGVWREGEILVARYGGLMLGLKRWA